MLLSVHFDLLLARLSADANHLHICMFLTTARGKFTFIRHDFGRRFRAWVGGYCCRDAANDDGSDAGICQWNKAEKWIISILTASISCELGWEIVFSFMRLKTKKIIWRRYTTEFWTLWRFEFLRLKQLVWHSPKFPSRVVDLFQGIFKQSTISR